MRNTFSFTINAKSTNNHKKTKQILISRTCFTKQIKHVYKLIINYSNKISKT